MGSEQLSAVAAGMGAAGVVLAALSIFLNGQEALTRLARLVAVAALVLAAAGWVEHAIEAGFRLDPGQRNQGSLFASAGMLLVTFGAARVADRRRSDRARARFLQEQAARRAEGRKPRA